MLSQRDAQLSAWHFFFNIIPFSEWLQQVKITPRKDNPASTLLDFSENNFLRISCGGLVLGTKNSVEHFPILAGVRPVSEKVMEESPDLKGDWFPQVDSREWRSV